MITTEIPPTGPIVGIVNDLRACTHHCFSGSSSTGKTEETHARQNADRNNLHLYCEGGGVPAMNFTEPSGMRLRVPRGYAPRGDGDRRRLNS